MTAAPPRLVPYGYESDGRPSDVDPLRIRVYIDGDHSHAAIAADLQAWAPHLNPAGHVIALDDLDTPRNPGVRAAVTEVVAAGGYRLEVRAGRLAVLIPT